MGLEREDKEREGEKGGGRTGRYIVRLKIVEYVPVGTVDGISTIRLL